MSYVKGYELIAGFRSAISDRKTVCLAEVSSFQPEYNYLSKATGRVEHVQHVRVDHFSAPGAPDQQLFRLIRYGMFYKAQM